MNPALEKRLKRQVIGKSHRFLAVVPLGFEQTFVNEFEFIRKETRVDNQTRRESQPTELGMTEPKAWEQPHIIGDGKVEFTTKLTDAWKIVAYSRIANRVLMHIADFKAENFRELEKKAAEIPFELYLTINHQPLITIHVTCKHSRLYHSDAVAERLQKAIEGSLSKGGGLPLASVSPDNARIKVGMVRQAHQPEQDSRACRGGEPSATPSAGTPRNAPKSEASSESKARPLTPWFDRLTNRFIAVASEPTHQNLYVTLIDDRCTIWLDLAGEELYKRGFERFVNDAPLKETIAAAMIFEAIHCMDPIGTPCLQDDRLQDDRNGVATLTTNHQPLATLLDPMSGSGTFSLEAASIAHNIIPGVCREFALMHQPAFKEATWNYLIRRENGHSPTDKKREMATATIVKIVTSDIDERSIKIIKHNVECSPLADIASNGNSPTVIPQLRDFFSYTAKEIAETCGDTSPILVLNPPYGKRLDFDAPKLYTKIGKKLAELACELKAFGKPLTVAILAPKDDTREGSKYTCTTNLLRECPALAPNKKSTAKLIETSHGGFSLNVLIAKI
jgi:putative N6-adenine-specific DNA methylase